MPRRRSFASAGVSDGDLISLLRARPQAPAPAPPPAAQGVAMPARNADGSLADPQGFMRGLLANPGLMASIPPALADAIRRGDAATLNNYFRRACSRACGAASVLHECSRGRSCYMSCCCPQAESLCTSLFAKDYLFKDRQQGVIRCQQRTSKENQAVISHRSAYAGTCV